MPISTASSRRRRSGVGAVYAVCRRPIITPSYPLQSSRSTAATPSSETTHASNQKAGAAGTPRSRAEAAPTIAQRVSTEDGSANTCEEPLHASVSASSWTGRVRRRPACATDCEHLSPDPPASILTPSFPSVHATIRGTLEHLRSSHDPSVTAADAIEPDSSIPSSVTSARSSNERERTARRPGKHISR